MCVLFGVLNKTTSAWSLLWALFLNIMQLSLFCISETIDLKQGFTLEEVFDAYFSCRSNKRNTINALAFELDYESKLIQLWNDLNDGSYQPGKSIAFIVNKPVLR